jgi:hypothetical protein
MNDMNELENDAFWTAPGIAEIRKRADERGVSEGDAADELLRERAANIAAARGDPFRFGYEPDIWLVCRAMLGLERIPDMIRHALAWRTGFDEARCWQLWRDRLCSNMNLPRYVVDLMINGANRAAKTDFQAKAAHEVGMDTNRRVWFGSQQWQNSLETVQARMYRYLPKEWRRDLKSSVEYIKYSEKNGFTGNSFVNRMGTQFKFLFYTQRRENALEGTECHLACMDEEVPQDWLEALRMRTASVNGRIITGFTPISGYTPAVAEYLDGMRIIRRSHAYMLPRDGGRALPWRALGLSRGEYEQLLRRSDMRDDMPQTVPSSRAEDCVRWGMEPWREIDENAEPGRVWETVPRVALCRDAGKAVVWFHGRDNPYGNPMEVIRKAESNTNALDEIKKRVYGIALKAKGKRFKTFDRAVHVVAMQGQEISCSYEVLCYREWPGADEVAGHGVPDPWAKRSSRKKGLNDGDPDGGQESFGFGVLRYKFEIARLEGWRDWEDWCADGCPGYFSGGCPIPYDDDLETWSDIHGSRENVTYRIVDGRACVQSKIGMMADKTLIDLLNEAGMSWEPASGRKIISGEDRINSALAWERGKEGEMVKKPGLMFSDQCKNHIFAMENYMGSDGDGQKGACKEPIDTLRYLFQSGLTENPPARDMNVLVMDPAPERNWFMGWYRIKGSGGDRRSEYGDRRSEERERPEAGGGGGGGRNAQRSTFNAQRSTGEGGGGWDAGR